TAVKAPDTWLSSLREQPFLREARRRLQEAGRLELAGLAGPLRTLLPLLLAEPPLLVVVPKEREVDEAASDLRTLAQEAGLAGAVLPFPAPGPAPFRGLPRHPDASLRRAAALHAASQGRLLAMVA